VKSTFLFNLIGLLVALGLSGSASAKPKIAKKLPKAKSSVILGLIDGESDNKLSVVNVRFNKQPEWTKVSDFEDHGTFIQAVLPDVMVPEPGKFYEGNSPYIKKIAAFQVSAKDAGIRFFLSQPAKHVKQALKAEILGKRVVVTLDHAKLKPLIAKKVTVVSEAQDIVATTTVDRSIPSPAEKMSADPDTGKIGAAAPNFRAQLINAAIFCGALLLFLLGVILIRPYLRRKRAGGEHAVIDMKTLATLPLAAKQRLSLIEVAGEKILLGVTPENISFITTIDTGSKVALSQASTQSPQAFAGMLQESPNVDPASPKRAAPKTHPRQEPVLEPTRKMAPKRPPVAHKTNLDQRAIQSPMPSTKPRMGAAATPQNPRKRINIGVGEEGVTNFQAETKRTNKESARTKIQRGGENAQAIEDVTRLIRDKLKTLKSL
jgi:flagellar biogenesis protein FliO